MPAGKIPSRGEVKKLKIKERFFAFIAAVGIAMLIYSWPFKIFTAIAPELTLTTLPTWLKVALLLIMCQVPFTIIDGMLELNPFHIFADDLWATIVALILLKGKEWELLYESQVNVTRMLVFFAASMFLSVVLSQPLGLLVSKVLKN